MTFDEIYATMKTYFEQRDFEVFGQGVYSYEFDVTGEGEGKFYIESRTAALICSHTITKTAFAHSKSAQAICAKLSIEIRLPPLRIPPAD